jgi:hypothetical protein
MMHDVSVQARADFLLTSALLIMDSLQLVSILALL